MATLPFWLNADLSRGYTVSQIAEKHGWPEPMVWSIALRGMDDLERFFALLKQHTKTTTTLAFINADWRDFQNKPAKREIAADSILLDDYLKILEKTGWLRTHIIQAPLSSERFEAGVVSAMQKKKILGITSRYVIILKLAVQKGD